jgi:type VI protein secretion system component Hcp
MPIYYYLLLVPESEYKSSTFSLDIDEAIKGDVQASGHVQWIDVTSYVIKSKGGPASTNRSEPQTSPGDLLLTRRAIDGISPILMRWAITGTTPIEKPVTAILDIVKDKEVVANITLKDVSVSSYQTNGDGGAGRGESFTLSYAGLQYDIRKPKDVPDLYTLTPR